MQKILLVLKEIKANFFITMIVVLTVIAATVSLGAFIILGNNFNRYISVTFAASIPPNTIKVSPKYTGNALLPFAPKKKNPGSVLDEATLLAIGQMKGVKRFYGIMNSDFPMHLVLNIFGMSYRTDLVSIGMPYLYIKDDLKRRDQHELWRNWKPGQKVPILIPRMLLDSYNSSLAEANNLPRINEDFAIDRELEVLFGYSSIKKIDGFKRETGLAVGFSDKLSYMAVMVPLSVIQYYNRMFKGEGADKIYMSAFVEVTDHAALLTVKDRIQKMGYTASTDDNISRQIRELKNTVNTVINLVMGIILTLSLIAVAFSTVIATLNRVEYYRLLRILGASKLFLTFTILVKYALLGFLATTAGLYLVHEIPLFLGSKDGSWNIMGFAVNIVLKPEDSFRMVWGGTLLSVLSTVPALFRLYTRGMQFD